MTTGNEHGSQRETRYLLRSTANAERLASGIAQLEAGEVVEVCMAKLTQELD